MRTKVYCSLSKVPPEALNPAKIYEDNRISAHVLNSILVKT